MANCEGGGEQGVQFQVGVGENRVGIPLLVFVSSSEFQLDETTVESLYLHVSDLSRTPAGPNDEDGFTLHDIAKRIQEMIAGKDLASVAKFDNLLSSSGFEWNHDYSDDIFVEGIHRTYTVKDDFPRITPASFGGGVSRVKYAISLTECEEYMENDDDVMAIIKGISDGN